MVFLMVDGDDIDADFSPTPKRLSEREVYLALLGEIGRLNNLATRTDSVRARTALEATSELINRLATAIYYATH